jgi:polyferredoxin
MRPLLFRLAPQIFRRLVQLSVVVFMVYAAAGGPWRNFKRAHNSRRLVGLMEGDGWAMLYGWNDDFLGLFGESYEVSLNMLGMPWAATLFGLETADPIMAMGHMLSTLSFSTSLFLGLLLPLGVAALLGKVFCSHLCPARFIFDIAQAVRRGLIRLGIPMPTFRSRIRLGGWVLLGGLVGTLTAGMGVWLLILPYVAAGMALFFAVSAGALSGLFFVVAGWVLLDLFFAPGFFCHNLCPQGFLLETFARFAPLRLTKKAAACPSSCRTCEKVCPYGLSPRLETHRPACDNCGVCAAACPQGLLAREVIVPKKRAPKQLPVVGMLALCVLAMTGFSEKAQAHHNKGLPHYGYFENYPQVPTEEYVYIEKGYEFGGTIFNFQGYDLRRTSDTPNDVKFFVYVYDLKADKAYLGPADFQILLDDKVVSAFSRTKVDEETIYSTRETLPESGEYVLAITLKTDPPMRLDMPFEIDLATDRVNWALIGGLSIPVFLVFILAIYGRSRRAKKPRPQSSAMGAGTASVFLAAAGLTFGLGLSHPAMADGGEATGGGAVQGQPQGQMACGKGVCGSGGGGPAGQMACGGGAGGHGDGSMEGGHTMTHYTTEDGGQVMVMGGIPRWLFLVGVAGILLLSFLVVEIVGSRKKKGFRLNLIANKKVYRFVRHRAFQAIPQLTMAVLLFALLYAGLFGSRVQNIAPVAVWTIWWAGLIIVIALLGPLFCFACPWDGLANLASRLRAWAKVEPISFGLNFPAWLKNVYPAIFLFVMLTWLELGFGVTTDPRGTAYMGLCMASLAILFALLYDGKKFCAHLCPVGRISGIYSNFAPVEIRGKNPSVCAKCKTEDCLHGAGDGYACPTGISLKVIQDATHCTFCTECIKSCKKQNIAFNLRPFGADLDVEREGRMDEAWLALALLALTLFHGLSMTPAWENFAPGGTSLLKWMSLTLGTPKVINFTVAMVLANAIPIALYWVSCRVAAAWTGHILTPKTLFIQFAYSLLPVALFYHLAHNLMHLLMEGGAIIPMLSDPLGTGADYFGTRDMHVGHLVSEQAIWITQVVLILIGHVIGIVVAHRIGHRLFSDRTKAAKSLVPMFIIMVLISVGGLGLMAMDMNMRVGRM